ncbi:MAG: hypothetical protein E6Q30_05170 [Aquabacterium sp.]|nr:MAG: hypothetical protein E6Q30_05170 [Aquabacterium sp.]
MAYPSNDEYQEFYAAIGRGIVMWAEIENKLSLVYSYLVFDTSQAAQDSFYSVSTFHAKLNLVDAASRSGFIRMENMGPVMGRLKAWNNLKNRLSSLSKDRNRLAHHRVILYGAPKGAKQSNVVDLSDINYELRLCRPHIPTIRPSKEGIEEFTKKVNETFSLPEIREHIKKVNNILEELIRFSDPLFDELGEAKLKRTTEIFKQISGSHNPDASK